MSHNQIVVYHDPTYPSVWIDASAGYPSLIASFFRQKNISCLDAVKLRDFVTRSLDSQTAHSKIILFSQDIVPDTICQEAHSNTLLREYLDAGVKIRHQATLDLELAKVKAYLQNNHSAL